MVYIITYILQQYQSTSLSFLVWYSKNEKCCRQTEAPCPFQAGLLNKGIVSSRHTTLALRALGLRLLGTALPIRYSVCTIPCHFEFASFTKRLTAKEKYSLCKFIMRNFSFLEFLQSSSGKFSRDKNVLANLNGGRFYCKISRIMIVFYWIRSSVLWLL